jgi:hypothetical protein
MKNAVSWDIKTQFIPHRRYITSPLAGVHEDSVLQKVFGCSGE